MMERNEVNRCLRRRIVIRLVLLLLCIAGAIAMAVSGSDVEDKHEYWVENLERHDRKRADIRDEIRLQLQRLDFDSEGWSLAEEEKRQRDLESLLNENERLDRGAWNKTVLLQTLVGEWKMFYLCAFIIGGVGLLLLVSLISFTLKRNAMDGSREKVWWRRPTVVASVVFAVGVLSMGWMAEMTFLTIQRRLNNRCENCLYSERVEALEREYSLRKSTMSRDAHRWSSARHEAVMSRLKAINKELEHVKDLEDRSSIWVSNYCRWSKYYEVAAIVLFFVVVVPAYLVLLACSVGEWCFYAVIRLIGIGWVVTHLKKWFGNSRPKSSGYVSRAARVSSFFHKHKVILMVVLGVIWLTVMIVYAVNKISAACRERGGGPQQQEPPQRVSCAQGTSDRERTERERESREETERESAVCDQILLKSQMQQQMMNQQLMQQMMNQQMMDQQMMQQMINQQPINFAPMPSITPTPSVSHTRTCTIHNCEYNPAFGGCPMCKAPDFGNGRQVCCPKCGMSHNSQYNCPRCGAW